MVDHKTYWYAANSEDEAAYLAAVLNSDAVNDAIKPFQARGLMGERHIHKKPLELPLRMYNDADALHVELAAMGKKATAHAATLPRADDFPNTLAARRAVVREALADVRKRIDQAVTQLFQRSAS